MAKNVKNNSTKKTTKNKSVSVKAQEVNKKSLKVIKNEVRNGVKKSVSSPSKTESKLYGQVLVEAAELERFPNRTLVRRYEIEFSCPEFTCLCPRSGFPDFATIYIRYVPDQWCVELKSLKLYINKFRNDKIFHEDVTNLILDELVNLLDPWEIEVVGDFNVRGNIKTVITSSHSKEE